MNLSPTIIQGLSDISVSQSRNKYGNNRLEIQDDRGFRQVLKQVFLEPMFILLLAACLIYFFVGKYGDGAIMLVSIFIVAGISLYQDYRSQNAIEALRKLSAPRSNVIRNGTRLQIPA